MATTQASPRPAPSAPRPGFSLFDSSRPVWQLFLVFLMPLMISNVLQSATQTLSYVFVGRFLGIGALGAVSAVFPVIFLLMSFLLGLGAGSSVLIGQAHGAGDAHRVKKIAGTVLGATTVFGIACALAGQVVAQPMLAGLGTPQNILPDAVAYAKVVFAFSPILFPYFVYISFLRGVGDSMTPLNFLVVNMIAFLLLAPAFILGWAGLPKLGVVSIALASGISYAIAFGAFLVWLSRKRHQLRFDRETARDMLVDWHLLGEVLKIGVPTGIQTITVALAEIAVISFVNRFGSNATAAYGAVNQIFSYVQFPAFSIAIAASIFSAQAIGARREDLLAKVLHAAVGLNYVVGGVLIALCYLFSRAILSWFITDQSTLEIAHTLLMITLWSFLLFGNSAAISWVVRGSGDVLVPTINGIFGIWAIEVPAAYTLMHFYGLNGVWMGYPIAFAVTLGLQYAYYTLFWKRRTHARLV
jgi:putative MATE family efflux protein